MSWALEEWKEGLPTRALQKIQELEGQLDKLKKERQQRQFQLETLEAALQKQKQKVENEKTEGTNLKRENQSLMETCENLEKAKQKIAHELQVKESQVNFQEGQLSSSKKQIEKLEQELKRCKSDLERSQQAAQSADASLNPCNTPQKIFTTPLTPSQYYSGSKYEDLKEKYNKEVEERKRLEAEVKALQAKKASQAIAQNTMNHRDIARHHSSSSVFSWQQEKTPSRHSDALQTPVRRGFSASHFPGEQEVTPSGSILKAGRRDANSSFCDNSSNSSLLEQLKGQNQELRSKIGELELRLQGQEKEMKGQVNKWQELQLQLEKAKVELNEKEKVLNKSRDELVRTTAQYDQASAKYTALEQKLKKLTEDLSCQRQNAESARCSLEQKLKEKEKEFHEELSRQQRSFQTLDQEYTQVKAKLTQELQQAKSAHNILQADLDKVTSVKHQLEKKLDEFKQNFCRTEQALQASETRESELRRSSEEMKKENSFLKSQSEQSAREVCHLQEELKKTKRCLSESQASAEEMRAKNTSQETTLRDLQEKINQQENSLTLEKLKLALADLEKQRDCSQDLLKQREHHIEQLSEKLSKTERESEALLSALELKKKEFEELKEEKTRFSHWKSENEQLVKQMKSDKESLQGKIDQLETCLKTQQIKSNEYNERVSALERERENLNVEVRNLHNVIDSRTVEVETQKQAYTELQQKAEFSDQKHKKEMENMCLKVSELTEQVEDLKHKLQLLSSEITDKDQRYLELHFECESLRDLLKASDSLVTNEPHHRSLLASEQQSVGNDSFVNILGEQGSMPSERSNSHVDADQSPENSAVLKNRVISLEFSLESQKQMNSDLQKQCEDLVQVRGEIEENLIRAEQMHQSFVAETSQRISRLQEDTSMHQNVVTETLAALENKDRELLLLNERLESEQAEIQELKKSNHLLQDSLKELQLLSETLSSEKKETSSILSLNKKEIEELTQENGILKELNATLNQEKMALLQKSESFSQCIVEREKSISELSNQYDKERLALLQRCEETGSALEDISEKYKATQEMNSKLECMLNECTSVCEKRKNELEQLKETFAKEHETLIKKLALVEERNQNLVQELGSLQQDLRAEIIEIENNHQKEANGLKQEIMTLKEEHGKMQKEVTALLQENEQLVKLMETKHEHQHVEVDPIRDSVTERASEINKCLIQLPMELEVKGSSPDSCDAQLAQLETKIRNMALKLEESEKEKECLQQELQTIKRESESGNLLQDTQSQEISGPPDCEIDTEEKYMSVLQELPASQNDNVQLQCSLQTAMNKLNELEAMCETLRAEKFELLSELNDSRSECVSATSKIAEDIEKLVSEVKILNDEHGRCQDELVEDMPEGERGEQLSAEMSVSWNTSCDDNFYEHLILSNKEVQTHFAELQEKFSSLQSEHKILHDQHRQMSSKMSQLQSYVDTLKTENLVLSLSLRHSQGDLVKVGKVEPGEEHSLSLSFSCLADSPSLTSLGELSFYKDLFEQTGETSLLNSLEGNVSANQSNLEEVSCSRLEEEDLSKKAPAPGKSTEELEVLCQMYMQSLKKLEEKIESQEVMKNQEIEELQQLLNSEREELDCLRKQHLSENEQWQQKLASVTVEMESKLAAEKKQTEHLSLELEVARLQLQGLDLSTRSLLGADLEDAILVGNNSCDSSESKECTSAAEERTPKQDIHPVCDKGGQQDLSPEMEKVSKTGAAMPAGERSQEQSPETRFESLVEDKTQDFSEDISGLSLSGPDAPGPVGFLETQVTIQNLQQQVKETSCENLRLLHAIEERDQNVEILRSEIKELDLKLNLQQVQLTTKIETCRELGETVEELKKEKSDLMEKLKSFSCDNPEFCQRVEGPECLNSSLEAGTATLSNEVAEGDVAKVNDSWRERFHDVEGELERTKSEKGHLEQHVRAVEADLQAVRTDKLHLENDNENKQRVICCLEEELSGVTSERNRLHGDLATLSKENKDLGLVSEKMKERIQELESRQAECLHHIDTVEAEIKDKTQQLQTLSTDVSGLVEDKARLLEQLQSSEKDSQALSLVKHELENEIGQLNREKESLVRESESMQNQLREMEQEKLTVTEALEAAVMEKGEVVVRLNSTQDEVRQLRTGIEKLRVRIEADEQKRLHVLEKLKESERRNDSLQDKVENLERELQMAEENQEAVILDAENAKAEMETLKSQIELTNRRLEALELDLVAVKSEKENLTQQLQEKQGQVSELDTLLSSLKNLVEEKEQEKIQVKEEFKATVEMLQAEWEELTKQVAALCGDQETGEVTAQSLGSSVQGVHLLRNSIEKLKTHLEADEKKHLHVLEKLQDSEHHADLLKERVEDLERELEMSRKIHEHVVLEAGSSKAEVETLQAQIERMAPNLRDLELGLVNIRSEKESLTEELQKEQGRVSELEILKSSLENLLREKEEENVQLKEDSKIAEERLQTQLNDLKEKVAVLCDDQETWKTREQDLSDQVGHLEHEKSQLLQGLDEAKSNHIILQSSVNSLIQEVEDGKQKLEKKEEEINGLKSQIQDQEELLTKLSQVEGEQQVWKKQKADLENLMVELEQKIQGLQSKNDSLQDTFVALQSSYMDLEKELEVTKMEKVSFVEQVNAMTSKEAELQSQVHEMIQKMTELKEEFTGEKNRLTEEKNRLTEEKNRLTGEKNRLTGEKNRLTEEKNRLTEELTLMLEETKTSKSQLKEFILENSELKRSLDCLRKDQMEKQEKMTEEIAAYQLQLQDVERTHHALLLDTNKQHEKEIQTYREKLTSKEECLSSQKVEIDLLKASKEELNNSLKTTTVILEELKKTKMDSLKHASQLKKDTERAQGKIKLLIKSCKQLEEEKELLQKELSRLEGSREQQQPGTLVDAHVDELMTEVKELKETIEEKTKEADEYLDKYCSLLISHEKLERAKEMLETQVARLSSALPKSVVLGSSLVPSATEKVSPGQSKAPGKRQRRRSSGIREAKAGRAPSTPESFPKRSRKAVRSGLHPAEDVEDTEFEPEGLPEVVKKGFADIPTGKTSPYVLRRTTMATRTSPRLAAQKLAPSPLNILRENHAETSKPTAGGSRSQKVSIAQQSPADSGAMSQEPTTRPLTVSNRPDRGSPDSPREGLRPKRGRFAASPEAGAHSSENCKVQ
ncbi:centromere protein F [Saccopteryx leptura]|uniref:centromere protein F n=1 Tax=Saccopteryx leptura TaxID=249018 RepID=UPI00339C0EB1